MKSFLFDMLMILGSLALFIYGMKVMSDGIQKAAGDQLRNRLNSLAKNKTRGILTGLITTSLLQSSSATTVMIVSLVNAGLITLSQSVPVIFGANIGTTITAWIVTIGGFVFKIQDLALPLLVVAVPLSFRAKGKMKYWSEFLTGFSILFLGLGFLQSSIPQLNTESEIIVSLQRFTQSGYLSSFLFVIIGILVTYVFQSSSAAMTLTLTMLFNGWIPLELAAAMVLGENIGTTITAELASLVGNIYARRSARTHTLFNVIGSVWMIFLIPFIIDFIKWGFNLFTEGTASPIDPKFLTIYLASFHTLFNVLNAMLLISFIPLLIKIATWTWPQRKKKQLKPNLKNISSARTPELSLMELRNEMEFFGDHVEELLDLSREFLNNLDKGKHEELFKKISKGISRSAKKNKRIAQYIQILGEGDLSTESSEKLKKYSNVSYDLNSISELLIAFSEDVKNKKSNNVWFTPTQRKNLNYYFDKIEEVFEIIMKCIGTTEATLDQITDTNNLQTEIIPLKQRYKEESIKAEQDFDFNVEGTNLHLKLVDGLDLISQKNTNIMSHFH